MSAILMPDGPPNPQQIMNALQQQAHQRPRSAPGVPEQVVAAMNFVRMSCDTFGMRFWDGAAGQEWTYQDMNSGHEQAFRCACGYLSEFFTKERHKLMREKRVHVVQPDGKVEEVQLGGG